MPTASRWPAHRVWLVYNGVQGLVGTLSWVTAAVYFIHDVHMTPLDLLLTGTALEVALFVFEIPTGVVADLVSRRLSIVIGAVVSAIAMLATGLLPHTVAIWGAAAVWGLGWTFRSGAEDAWLADEIGPQRLGAAYQRGAQVARVGGLVGIVAAVGLALVDLALPFLAAGLISLALAGLLVLVMPERGFVRPQRSAHVSQVRSLGTTLGRGWRLVLGHPVLVLVLAVVFVEGTWAEGFDRLKEAHFLVDVGLPKVAGLDSLVWFGILEAAALILSFVVAAPLVRRIEVLGQEPLARLLALSYAALLGCSLVFALAGSLWLAVAGYLTTTLVRELTGAPFRTWLNTTITDSSVRSTVLSITGVSGSAGEWAGGPALGLLGTRTSVRVALSVGSLLLAPAVLLMARAARHHGSEPELVDADAAARWAGPQA